MTKHKEKLIPGKELFENYLEARSALISNLKRVIAILIQCDALDINPKVSLDKLKFDKNLGWVSGHQWQYAAGHEEIYCQHTYNFSRSWSNSDGRCTIKVPLSLLGMSDTDIYKLYRDVAIKELEAKKAAIEKKIQQATAPYNSQLEDVEEQMAALMKTACT